MSGEALAITALGMVTSLGRDVVTSCAAARAGMVLGTELKVLDVHNAIFGEETRDGGPVIYGHTVRGVADGFAGLGKVLQLGGAALADLLRQRPIEQRQLARMGMAINLSDQSVLDIDAIADGIAPLELPSTSWRERTKDVARRLIERQRLPLQPERTLVCHGGNAGLANVLQEAMSWISHGKIDGCIVGAIDSRVEPAFLSAAARLRVLRTKDNPVGLIPGEAAAFFMIERARASVTPLGYIGPVARATGPASLLSEELLPTGVALAEVLRAVSAGRRPGFLIGDLNGTARRALEWGNALVRLHTEKSVDALSTWHPASSFGDIGAASGAVAICLAARAFVRGYAPAPTGVVWLSSESGATGAISVRVRES